jgi:hypothetical protein
MLTTHNRHTRGRRGRRVVRRVLSKLTAAEAIGELSHGCEIFGLTKGQFSLVDVVEHCLATTGPAAVTMSTWTAGGADLEFAYALVGDGRIESLRFVVDFSFPRRQPAYCAALRERFGDDAVRLTKVHAKFVVIRNTAWAIVIRSSMNLNENRRLEWFEVSDDAGMASYLLEVCDSLFDGYAAGAQFELGAGKNCRDFETWLGDGIDDRDVRRSGWTSQRTGKPLT